MNGSATRVIQYAQASSATILNTEAPHDWIARDELLLHAASARADACDREARHLSERCRPKLCLLRRAFPHSTTSCTKLTIMKLEYALVFAVTSVSALKVFIPRQAIDNPACAPNCTAVLVSVEACNTPGCLCNNSTAAQVLDCVNCAVQKEATLQDIEDDTAALNAYGQRCAAAGSPLIPLSISAPGSSSASSPGTASTSASPSSPASSETSVVSSASTSSSGGSSPSTPSTLTTTSGSATGSQTPATGTPSNTPPTVTSETPGPTTAGSGGGASLHMGVPSIALYVAAFAVGVIAVCI